MREVTNDRGSGAGPGNVRSVVTLLAISVMGFLVSLDTTVVGVVLPEVGRTLHLAFSDLQWVANAYSLAFVALLMSGGVLADRFGRRKILAIGIAVFSAASIRCGIATNGTLLHTARAAQGVGAAIMMSAGIAILAYVYQAREARAAAFGVWGTAVGLGVAIGPLFGGIVSQTLGWRWAFLINLPIGTLLVLATLWAAPESRNRGARRLDVGGVALFALTLFFLVFALVSGNGANWAGSIWAMLALSFVLLGAFVVVESRLSEPMMDIALFRRPDFVGVCLAPLATSVSFWSLFIFLPLYLRGVFAVSPVYSGLALAPLAVPMVIVPAVAQRWLAPRLSARVFLSGGLFVIGIGTLIAAFGVSRSSVLVAAIGLLVTGIGAAGINAENASAVVSRVPVERSGMASGIAGTMRQLGFGIGIAALGAVLDGRIRANLAAHNDAWESNVDAVARYVSLGDLSAGAALLKADERAEFFVAAHASLAHGFAMMLLVAGIFALASATAVVVLVKSQASPQVISTS